MSIALHHLIAGVVDYAGLFPPALLPMERVVPNFADYLGSPQRWMLGRLIVPLGRLEECKKWARPFFKSKHEVWKISCLLPRFDANETDSLRNQWRKIAQFNTDHQGCLSVDAVEIAVSACGDIPLLATSLVSSLLKAPIEVFVELPHEDDCSDHFKALAAIKNVAMRAKIRTGGMLPNQFPAPEVVAGFVAQAVKHKVPFKATAGLHHPIRAPYSISYEEGCPRVVMHGFLNLILATVMARTGQLTESQLVTLLEEVVPAEIRIGDESIGWRGIQIRAKDIEATRRECFRSFGSCSFVEPVEDLQALGYLPDDSDEPIPNATR